MAYIYQIKNKINNKIYIGSTNDYKRRWYQHKSELKNNKHINKHLQYAWNKYNEENFEFSILEECDIKEQYIREQYYFNYLNPFGDMGYNICTNASGGGNNKGESVKISVYTNNQILEVKKLIIKGLKNSDISKITNVKEETISAVRALRMWKDVGCEYNEILYYLYNKNKNKLLKEDITYDLLEKAYILKKEGKSSKEIHEILNCSSRILTYPLRIYIAKKNGKKIKKCEVCDKDIVVKSGNQKYCKKCAKEMKKIKSTHRTRKHRENNKISA